MIAAALPCIPMSAQAPEPSQAPPGVLIDIGGHRLHLLCSGAGGPTVILEAGLGAYSVDWGLVQPQVAKFARVCSYDRASYAWSDQGPEPRGLRASVGELHRLLERAGIGPHYVLVGQSWGGRIVRLFAHTYPQEVAGMVLIDTFSEGSAEVRVDPPAPESPPPEAGDPADKLPAALGDAHRWAAGKARQPDITDVNEDPGALIRSTTEGVRAPLGDRPLIAISAGRLPSGADDRRAGLSPHDKLRAHLRQQAFLATLSRNSRFLIARQSFHEVHLYEPDLVADAIRQVVAAARSGRRLGE